jgi:hypothetical protein
MKKVTIEITGTAPLLMNRFAGNDVGATKAKRMDEQYSIEKDIEKALYRDPTIGCYVPNSWIEACLRETAKTFKAARGKGTLKKTVLSSIFVDEEKIPLNKSYDEADIRPVVIMGHRVVKGRPRFNSWSLQFTLTYDEKRIDIKVVRQLTEESGISTGIGDYRPRFGRFRLSRFEEHQAA